MSQTDNQCAHSHGLLSLVICSRPIHSPCRPSCCECTYRSVLICSNPDFGPPPRDEEKYWHAAQVTCRPLIYSISNRLSSALVSATLSITVSLLIDMRISFSV